MEKLPPPGHASTLINISVHPTPLSPKGSHEYEAVRFVASVGQYELPDRTNCTHCVGTLDNGSLRHHYCRNGSMFQTFRCDERREKVHCFAMAFAIFGNFMRIFPPNLLHCGEDLFAVPGFEASSIVCMTFHKTPCASLLR